MEPDAVRVLLPSYIFFRFCWLTNLCQDSSLDIVLRLQLLEVSFTNRGGNADTIVKLTRPEVFLWQVIELRSLGWKPDPTVEKYYEERFVSFPSGWMLGR